MRMKDARTTSDFEIILLHLEYAAYICLVYSTRNTTNFVNLY